MGIREKGGPIETSSKDFVGSGFPVEMTSTLSLMKLMHDFTASSSSKHLSKIPIEFFQYKDLSRM